MVQYSAHDISCFYLSKCSKFVKHNLDDLSLLHRFSRIVDHTSTNIIKSSNKLLNRFIRHVQTVGKFCCKLALHCRLLRIILIPNCIPCSSQISNLTVGTYNVLIHSVCTHRLKQHVETNWRFLRNLAFELFQP